MPDIRVRGVVAIIIVTCFLPAGAQPNHWINPASGRWDDGASWSLGVRPANTQTVTITNTGSKAVAIFPDTPLNFPATMTISNLLVSGSGGQVNTLLLNYSGIANPLQVLNDVSVLEGGAIDNQFGALKVEGTMLLSGSTMSMQGGLLIATNRLDSYPSASLLVNFSTLSQTGGEVQAYLWSLGGHYSLSNGIFRGEMTLGDFLFLSGQAAQNGGTNFGDIFLNPGHYHLTNGAVFGYISGSEGSFVQVNGVINGSISAGGWTYKAFNYTMLSGTNHLERIFLNTEGRLYQNGGVNIVTNLVSISGYFDTYGPIGFGSYELYGGFLTASNLDVGLFGWFYQGGGTNLVRSDLVIQPAGGFNLSGGNLQTSNTFVADHYHRGSDVTLGTSFNHHSGTHIVADTLTVDGNYELTDGQLSAKDIRLRARSEHPFVIVGTNTTPVITNTGQFIVNGTLRLIGSVQRLGVLRLTADAMFDFSQIPGELSFLNSSAAPWTNQAILTITNWIGSTNGGGANRLVIGNTEAGIAPAHLVALRFVNPAGLPPGLYNAEVLATGEIVPALRFNSWTGPGSANWTDLNWSQGIRPTTNYSIFITNTGSKAVAIQPSTPASFPGAMTIRDLIVDAPDGYINTLLLNFSGTNNPLQVLANATIGTNGVLNIQNGALSVGWALTNNGSLLIDAGRLSCSDLYLRGGLATVNNSIFAVQTMLCTNGVFNQTSGAFTAYDVQLLTGGQYSLTNGTFHGGLSILGGSFKQSGGTVFFDKIGRDYSGVVTNGLMVQSGSYEMINGVLGGQLNVGFDGLFSQSNGSIRVSTLSAGNFLQQNGWNIATNVFQINGNFRQRAGTNIALGDLLISGAQVHLEGGLLQSSNPLLQYSASLYQTGGFHLSTGTLTNEGSSYFLSGGTLSASNILLSPFWIWSSTLVISNTAAPAIINPGQFSLFGNVVLVGSTQQLGVLTLTGDSAIDFTSTPGQLKFLNSNAAVWTNGATLTVSNWIGSVNGNGATRLVVGSNSSGLTSAQLAQIRFVNPASLPAGTYFATILPTGELVPTSRPYLVATGSGNGLVLTWPAPFILESATNVTGSYIPVPGATSPHLTDFTGPRRFFRLKQ